MIDLGKVMTVKGCGFSVYTKKYYFVIEDKCMGKVSESQKAAQKRYDKKTKMVSLKYTPKDIDQYDRLQEYLEESNESANGFIKRLIADFLSGNETYRYGANNIADDAYNPFKGIKEKNIQYLYKHFDKEFVNEILNKYKYMMTHKIQQEQANKFNEWVEHRLKVLVENDPKTSKARKSFEMVRLFNIKFQ